MASPADLSYARMKMMENELDKMTSELRGAVDSQEMLLGRPHTEQSSQSPLVKMHAYDVNHIERLRLDGRFVGESPRAAAAQRESSRERQTNAVVHQMGHTYNETAAECLHAMREVSNALR